MYIILCKYNQHIQTPIQLLAALHTLRMEYSPVLQQLLMAMQCYPLRSSINYMSTFIHYIRVVNYHNSMG